jgi:hypothetical protein
MTHSMTELAPRSAWLLSGRAVRNAWNIQAVHPKGLEITLDG